MNPQQRYLMQQQMQNANMVNPQLQGQMGGQRNPQLQGPMGFQQPNPQIPQFVQQQAMQRPAQFQTSAQNLPQQFQRPPQQGFAPNVSSAQNVAPQMTGTAPSGPNTSVQQHSVSAVSGANVHHSASMQETQPLTSAMLQNAKPEERKRFIGERLFPKIQAVEPRRAGKITGMLLEMDDTELLVLLHDNNALFNKINEALAVLKDHQIKQSAQNPSQQNASQQNASQLNNPRLSASNQQTSQSQTHQT
jgi:polyadenylate-binding protein